jgi:SAM-dependent methyltransferase
VLPASARQRWRLVPPAPGERRIEIGAGFSGRPGYVHVDLLPFTDDIDLLASGDALPIPNEWADEILSVHMIEHVHPQGLLATLRHWYERLRPGGVLVIHTPNGAALGQALADTGTGTEDRYWAVMSAVFGYGHHPADMTSPAALTGNADHKIVFTSPWLQKLMAGAGFCDIEDVSGQDPLCHHTRDWAPYVDGLCLEVRARRPER